MSYILDALKQSERERRREQPPSLRSIHAEFRVRDKAQVRLRVFTVASLLIAGAGIGVWLGKTHHDSAGIPAADPAGATIAASGEPVAAAPAAPVQAAAETPAAIVAVAEPEETVQQTVVATTPELLEIWQLSDAEQRFLHSLNVSLHVYSPDPAQRTVIINGLRAREGQPLGQDLSLLEITSDGIIVQFQQQRVHLATID